MSERLDEIKAKLDNYYAGRQDHDWPFPPDDVRWLVAEVERRQERMNRVVEDYSNHSIECPTMRPVRRLDFSHGEKQVRK